MPKSRRYETFGNEGNYGAGEENTASTSTEDLDTGAGVGPSTDPIESFPVIEGGSEADMADTDGVDVKEVERDYDCYCFGKKLINVAPKVILTFIVSILVIIFAFVYMFVKGDVVIFAPIVAGIIGFWLPSPTQSSQSRKDAVQNARLLQNNIRMNSMMMRYGIAKPASFGTDRRV